MCAKLLQSCLTLCDPTGYSPPGSSSMGFSRQEYWSGLSCPPPGKSSQPRNQIAFLTSPALAGGFFTTSATWGAQDCLDLDLENRPPAVGGSCSPSNSEP
ncbi:hypothetical protein R6Z07F_012183 [Ovis aries]